MITPEVFDRIHDLSQNAARPTLLCERKDTQTYAKPNGETFTVEVDVTPHVLELRSFDDFARHLKSTTIAVESVLVLNECGLRFVPNVDDSRREGSRVRFNATQHHVILAAIDGKKTYAVGDAVRWLRDSFGAVDFTGDLLNALSRGIDLNTAAMSKAAASRGMEEMGRSVSAEVGDPTAIPTSFIASFFPFRNPGFEVEHRVEVFVEIETG